MVAPSRGRGSKRLLARKPAGWPCRPFTGAWIETRYRIPVQLSDTGRPFTGAWIETDAPDRRGQRPGVAPSRGRGSKRSLGARPQRDRLSPLHGGVDRNTKAPRAAQTEFESPLHGGVDRNFLGDDLKNRGQSSPLHGGVDRNALPATTAQPLTCRPFTGAWIETRLARLARGIAEVAPSRGRGSKRFHHVA